MVILSVDEAYAFDFLSILNVKYERLEQHEPYRKTLKELVNQLGQELVDKILISKEYSNLYTTNLRIFDILEELKTGTEYTALHVDSLNRTRYLHKQALQTKFFKSNLIEKKS
jgi:predicted RND superfamily exporter protein